MVSACKRKRHLFEAQNAPPPAGAAEAAASILRFLRAAGYELFAAATIERRGAQTFERQNIPNRSRRRALIAPVLSAGRGVKEPRPSRCTAMTRARPSRRFSDPLKGHDGPVAVRLFRQT